jgi:cobalt-zinc-cadmium efflux system outer membrane protein
MHDSNCYPAAWLALLLAACAHAPARTPEHGGEAPAPHLREAASPGGKGERHPEHADPAPDPAQVTNVSLGGILAFADRASPVLAVARSTRSRVEVARAAARGVLADNPELTLAAGPRFAGGDTGSELEVSISQRLRLNEGGARRDVAERLRELTDAEIEEVRWLVHCEVHAEFHRVLVEQERVRIALGVREFQREVLGIVQRQIAAGEAAPLTLRLAEAEEAQAAQQLVGAEQALLAARIRLGQLSGWPAHTPPMASGNLDEPDDPPDEQRLLAVARERLPSLRTDGARVREAAARVELAERAAGLQPSLGVRYRREDDPGPDGTVDVLMGVVSLPIPSFDRNQSERAQARSDRTVAQAELDAAGRLLAGRIAEARSEVIAAARRTRTYGKEILPRFQENLVMLRRAFELGEIDILALSTGRERFLRIQSDALDAALDYFVALAALERVVGVDLWRDDHHAEDGQ